MDHEAATQRVSRRDQYILTLLWSFIGGVTLASFITISPLVALLSIALSGAVFVIERVYKGHVAYEVLLIVCVLGAFGFGALRYDVKDFHEPHMPAGEGYVASEPERRDADTRFIFQDDAGGRALVATDMYAHVAYGERVRVSCVFKEPQPIIESDGSVFNYPQFLAKDDVYYTCAHARVEVLAESGMHSFGSRFISTLLSIKSAFVQRMKMILPEPESSLLAGLIVAGKQALPQSILTDFKNAGVVHIVVLSGYNITIIAEFFLALLAFLSLRARSMVAAAGIIFFVLMAGAGASIIRAALMAFVVLVGRSLHRAPSSTRTLLLTAAVMVMWNPKLLVFDPSFQLSFLAMCALLYVEPLIAARLSFITEKGGVRTLVSATLATQLTVLPYLLHSSGSVSAVSLVSNLLILSIVPFTMLVGFIATLVAFVSTLLAWPLAYIVYFLLAWILGVARVLGSLSFSNIKISHFSVWLTLLAYAVLLTVVWRVRSSPRSQTN